MYALSVARYAGSFISRRIGIAPVTCLWISPKCTAE